VLMEPDSGVRSSARGEGADSAGTPDCAEGEGADSAGGRVQPVAGGEGADSAPNPVREEKSERINPYPPYRGTPP
jgi:hypothetical protein